MNDITRIERRLEHANKRLAEVQKKHGTKPEKKYNYFGGEEVGYWKGLVNALENVLDILEENRNKQ